jgi:hypothetical protein
LITERQVAGRTNGEKTVFAASRFRDASTLVDSASHEAEREPRRRTDRTRGAHGSRTHAHFTDEGGDKDMAKKVAKKPAKKAGKKR